MSGIRARRLVAAAGLVYFLGLGALLLAPLGIVRYHTLFWELTGRYLGLGWTAGRERALDAVVNIGLFVPLGFLGRRWRRAGSSPSWANAGVPLAFIFVVAAGIEITQSFLPWRHASVADVICDAIGAAAGAWLDALVVRIVLWSRRRGTRPELPGSAPTSSPLTKPDAGGETR